MCISHPSSTPSAPFLQPNISPPLFGSLFWPGLQRTIKYLNSFQAPWLPSRLCSCCTEHFVPLKRSRILFATTTNMFILRPPSHMFTSLRAVIMHSTRVSDLQLMTFMRRRYFLISLSQNHVRNVSDKAVGHLTP